MSSEGTSDGAAQTGESSMVGQICWLEVPVKSAPRAAAFYSAVLGWKCPDPEKGTPAPSPGTESIHMFNCGRLTGAFTKMASDDGVASVADAANPGRISVLATYMVESVDETLGKIEQAGGKVHLPKTEIGGNMGFFARFIDTEGNLQGIWAFK